MGTIASQITSLTIVYSTVYSDADQRKHQSSASLAFVRVIQRGPVNSPHKWPVTRKMFPFDDVIMNGVCQLVVANHEVTIFVPYNPFQLSFIILNIAISFIKYLPSSWIRELFSEDIFIIYVTRILSW